MNLVLIGYRGTGKSEVGALLATRLGMPVLSMDALIIERAGMPVPEIVAAHGWTGFRDLETTIAREIAARDGVIIDCGGGVIERPENIPALREHGLIVWLSASVATIVRRIQGDTQRPSLTGAQSFTDEVAEVLTRRTPLYRAAAHVEIATDALTPAEVAERVVEIWETTRR